MRPLQRLMPLLACLLGGTSLGTSSVGCSSNNAAPSSDAGSAFDARVTSEGAPAQGNGGGGVPRPCAQQGVTCGPAGDGCGGALQCGPCTAPETCGGGG